MLKSASLENADGGEQTIPRTHLSDGLGRTKLEGISSSAELANVVHHKGVIVLRFGAKVCSLSKCTKVCDELGAAFRLNGRFANTDVFNRGGGKDHLC
jgi:hypothetical protein